MAEHDELDTFLCDAGDAAACARLGRSAPDDTEEPGLGELTQFFESQFGGAGGDQASLDALIGILTGSAFGARTPDQITALLFAQALGLDIEDPAVAAALGLDAPGSGAGTPFAAEQAFLNLGLTQAQIDQIGASSGLFGAQTQSELAGIPLTQANTLATLFGIPTDTALGGAQVEGILGNLDVARGSLEEQTRANQAGEALTGFSNQTQRGSGILSSVLGAGQLGLGQGQGFSGLADLVQSGLVSQQELALELLTNPRNATAAALLAAGGEGVTGFENFRPEQILGLNPGDLRGFLDQAGAAFGGVQIPDLEQILSLFGGGGGGSRVPTQGNQGSLGSLAVGTGAGPSSGAGGGGEPSFGPLIQLLTGGTGALGGGSTGNMNFGGILEGLLGSGVLSQQDEGSNIGLSDAFGIPDFSTGGGNLKMIADQLRSLGLPESIIMEIAAGRFGASNAPEGVTSPVPEAL